MVRHVSRLFVTGASLAVPLYTIVLRKGYGLGAQAMAAGVDALDQASVEKHLAEVVHQHGGIDVSFNYYVNSRWVADFSYSWFDFEVKEQNARDVLLPNAPENKFSAGLSYVGDRLSTSLKYRWVDDFAWAAGIFSPKRSRP